MSELLRISGLWGGYKEGVDILRGIDMTVNEGEAVGIIGLNGSGKSTLGKAIMNMIPIRKGEIVFNGEDITGLSTHELARKGISIMQQGGQVFQNLSVWENLELAYGNGLENDLECIRDIFPMLQKSKKELNHKMADKLSGGQKHQLALSMALAVHPKLVILDEPSAGLAPKAVGQMYEIIDKVTQELNMSLILIEQNVSKAVQYCKRSLLLQQGQVVKEYHASSLQEIESNLFNASIL